MDGLRQKMSGLTPFAKKHKVTVVGSGNWGSTIAKLVAENTAAHPELFERDVQMWVYEETVDIKQDSKHYNESSELCKGPVKLTRVINELHENIKYLPEIALPTNLIANPDVKDAVKDSTILIFNMPHQFIEKQCSLIKGQILPFARGISCIKGVNVQESSVSLFSETIGKELGIYCGALSGANIANEVAQEKFSETTIAYDPPPVDSQSPTPATSRGPSPSASQVDLTKIEHKDVHGKPSKIKLSPLPAEYQPIDHSTIKKLFHRRYFHVRVVSDVAGVSLGGALKNVIALAAGWVDGLGWGDNAKAAVMRVGLLEMLEFGKRFFSKTVHAATFTEESAGVADLITTCNGGRHLRCARKSILEGKSIAEIEARDLNGQKLQGTLTAYEVQSFLKTKGVEKDFPLMTAVYNILEGNAKPEDLPDLIEPEDEIAPSSTSTHRTLHEIATAPNPRPSDLRPTNRASAGRDPVRVPDHSTSTNLTSEPHDPYSILIPPPPLASSRYNRQLLLPRISLIGQERILSSRVLVIGLGGLGSPVALYLAGAGVGTLGFVDGDVVEKSNLHRQIVHREDGVADPSLGMGGMSKVHSAIVGCRELNSEIKYVAHEVRLSVRNALGIIEQYDLVLDCTDNPATRYLISDACVVAGKTLISGAAQRLEGQLVVLNYPMRASKGASSVTNSDSTSIAAQNGLSARHVERTSAGNSENLQQTTTVERSPCYRCIFPQPPSPEMVQTCSEIGILGPVVGCIGTLMASEVLRLILQGAHLDDVGGGVSKQTGVSELTARKPSMLLYSAWPSDPKAMFRTIMLAGRKKGCVSCGDEEVLRKLGKTMITREVLERGRMDYEAWCGALEDVRVLGRERRLGAREFLDAVGRNAGGRGEEGGAASGGISNERSRQRVKGVVVDVREENEWILGAKIKGSINIPISKILRDPDTAFGLLEQFPSSEKYHEKKVNADQDAAEEDVVDSLKENDENEILVGDQMDARSMYFICQRGNDSQIAAQKLIDLDEKAGRRRGWVGDIEGGFIALERARQAKK